MVWIEIVRSMEAVRQIMSPPTRVVWIEIIKVFAFGISLRSPPTRVVWIEICMMNKVKPIEPVTTHTGGVD